MRKMLLFLVGNLVPQIVLACLFLWLAAVVEKDEFANLALLDSIYQGLLILTLFGLDKTIERYSFVEKAQHYAEELLVTASLTCLGIGLTGFALFFVVNNVTAFHLPAGLKPDWLYLLLVASTLGAIFQIVVSYKYAQTDALSFAILRASRALVFTLVLSLAVIYDSSVIFGRILADVVSCAVPLIFLLLVFGNPFTKYKYRLNIFRDVIPYAAPFVMALIASFTLNYVDRFFVAHYLDLESLANYSLSQRAVGIVTLVASSIALVVPPLFYKNIESDPEKVYSGIREVMSICFWLCIIASSLLPIALWLVYGEKYSGSLGYIPLLLVGVYFSVAVSSSTALCLLIDKRSMLNMITGVLAALASVGVNILLLPRIGIYGAIVAYVFSMTGLYGLQYYFAKKKYPQIPALISQPMLLFVICCTLSFFIEIDKKLSSGALYTLAAVGISATIFLGFGIKNAKTIHA